MVAILYKSNTKCNMVAILYKQTQNAVLLLYYMNKHKTPYGCYISYNTNTKRDMVAILYE